jgi:hypothetical protein
MVMYRPTKPNPPMGSAPRAQDPVGIGKARTAYITGVTVHHYHSLPSATTKPKEPIECGQYSDSVMIVDSKIVIVASGGGAKHRLIDPPTQRHSVADPHAETTLSHGGPGPLTPRLARFGRTTQLSQSKQTILVKNS